MTQFPRIHLNGTHGPDLLKDYTIAQQAVWAAIKTLQAVTPHGRDYYTIGGNAISTAMDDHLARLKGLTDIHCQLQAICFSLHDQIDDMNTRAVPRGQPIEDKEKRTIFDREFKE
jgi:hypothetical protein